MKIKSVTADWLHVPIPEDRQHVTDFGRISSFDTTLVRVETECGIVGHGEARAALDCPTEELTIERRTDASHRGTAYVDFYERFTGCGRTVVFMSTCPRAAALGDDVCPRVKRKLVEGPLSVEAPPN